MYSRLMGPQNINKSLFDDVVVMAWKPKYMKHEVGAFISYTNSIKDIAIF